MVERTCPLCFSRSVPKNTDDRDAPGLLCSCRKQRPHRRTPQHRNEIAPFHIRPEKPEVSLSTQEAIVRVGSSSNLWAPADVRLGSKMRNTRKEQMISAWQL